MKFYTHISEESHILEYLQSRQLLFQYKRAKQKLLSWYSWKLDLKERKPKGCGIFSFRINQQFRAFCIEEGDALIVFEISNHQNF